LGSTEYRAATLKTGRRLKIFCGDCDEKFEQNKSLEWNIVEVVNELRKVVKAQSLKIDRLEEIIASLPK
ncbi:hypothetical protein HHI36_001783, partial [Cryptolaemus montrouzieri]